MFLFLISLWTGAAKTEKVYRCKDALVDTGQSTLSNHKIYKLVRTHCRWELFTIPEKKKKKSEEECDKNQDDSL